ncbi:MAG: phenylacetate-CoA ligase [Pseudonocardiales bacterium]|nr:phenylacetate-CoA ligase [Pseudonocardiales bacterium]MDT7686271.1 phenylacetate-CoA ligase [Pseudonocardiales bacterium]
MNLDEAPRGLRARDISWSQLTELEEGECRRQRSALERGQLVKARNLLAAALTNPFYGPRYADAGLRPDTLDSLQQWRTLPVVDKNDLLADQQKFPPFGQRLGVPPDEVRQIHLTSGTSGFGQEAFALTEWDLAVSGSTWQWPLAALGLRPGGVFVTMYPVTFLTYGRSLLEGGRLAGSPVVSLAGTDTALAVALMERLQPAAVGARPAFLSLVEEHLAQRGQLPRDVFTGIQGLVCSGLAPSAVAATEERWNGTVHEMYGSSQAGGIIATTGSTGAARNGRPGIMYCLENHFLVEMVDPDTLAPVTAGEAEVVLTCLDRIASPIIRYRTRDRVTVVPSGVGDNRSPYQGIRVGTVGRFDDMLKIRGNNVWPQQLDEALLGQPAISDYLAEVTLDNRGVDVMTVYVRRTAGAAANDELWQEVRRRVKRATNVTPRVEDAPRLPPPALKPKRLVDLRSPGVGTDPQLTHRG